MAAKNGAKRYRVGRVSYYQHHGSWYLYYREAGRIRRQRLGRDEAGAERAAALKNAELTAGSQVSSPQLIVPATPALVADGDRRSFVASASALLAGLMELGTGLGLGQSAPAMPLLTIDAASEPPKPVTSVATLRQEFVDHHEQVIASALTTIRRYESATQHLVNFAAKEGVGDATAISAAAFTRYLRNIEVAPNGHEHTARRPFSEKSISFTLQTCGSMFRFGVEQGLLPKGLDNPFLLRGLRKLKVRRAKPIFLFDAATELKFLQAADPWSFAIHFTLAKTGLRPGELAHTLVEDIDFEGGWLRIRGKPELGWSVKTGTDRDVPLAPEVCEVLRRIVGERTGGPAFRRVKIGVKDEPRLIGNRKELARVAAQRIEQQRTRTGRKLSRREEAGILRRIWVDAGAVRADRIRNSLIHIAKLVGIEATCPKSWRHTFATLLQEANVDPLIRQVTLGHQPARPEQSALGMTGVYTHTQPEVQHREILRALQLRGASLALAR